MTIVVRTPRILEHGPQTLFSSAREEGNAGKKPAFLLLETRFHGSDKVPVDVPRLCLLAPSL